jgi:glc operon protein GlcG
MNMINQIARDHAEAIISACGKLIPVYDARPENSFSEGNVAICIMDDDGNVFGRLYGTDKIKTRKTYLIAWTKASQVWITGMKTVEFERKIFNGELNEKEFGIIPPDFIGWPGGQPVTLKDGTRLSIGFSGFTGANDLDIVQKAILELGI